MCQIKTLINVEQNPYWSIITSMLRSEGWVFTEHLEHPENTPMFAGLTRLLVMCLKCPTDSAGFRFLLLILAQLFFWKLACATNE